ncbi:MAG TPA: hypothetical protein VJM32_05525 [Candidatus Saccharimonadales bacterium]|nr:hypothetical protein [Candidatus Saccharimonadales bacterium]
MSLNTVRVRFYFHNDPPPWSQGDGGVETPIGRYREIDILVDDGSLLPVHLTRAVRVVIIKEIALPVTVVRCDDENVDATYDGTTLYVSAGSYSLAYASFKQVLSDARRPKPLFPADASDG